MEGEETKELAELMAITNLDFAHCVELYVASEKNF